MNAKLLSCCCSLSIAAVKITVSNSGREELTRKNKLCEKGLPRLLVDKWSSWGYQPFCKACLRDQRKSWGDHKVLRKCFAQHRDLQSLLTFKGVILLLGLLGRWSNGEVAVVGFVLRLSGGVCLSWLKAGEAHALVKRHRGLLFRLHSRYFEGGE